MKILVKSLVALVGVMLVLCITVAFVLSTKDPNDYKGWISTKFQEQTGRTLTLEGDIEMTFYPWLGMQANGVTISNAAGFGDQPFFSCRSS